MDNIQEIFTDKIKLPPNNMRTHIDRDEIFELVEDIKKNGLIQPITIRPTQDGYELVAGQRRYLAHQFAGILKIKCIIRELNDEEAFGIMTSENLARVDVNPLDEANHIARLMEYNNNDIKKVASIISRGEKYVRDRLTIGTMPEYLQEFLSRKEIKLGVALILNEITNDDYKHTYVLQAVRDGVSVAQAEAFLAYFKSLLLPGGLLAENIPRENIPDAPQIIPFICSIDGLQYDIRNCKYIQIYEGNLEYFNAFVSAFRIPPTET
jgi:ParB family chromosome partitioning protein